MKQENLEKINDDGFFIMLKKHALFSLALLCSTPLYAIPIESGELSGSNAGSNNIANSPAPIAGNLNWDLIQKSQQLENQLRELRGKMEEQDHTIDQLTKELSNRYTDLDQRLELINQKLEAENAPAEGQSDAPAGAVQPTASATSQIAPIKTTPQSVSPSASATTPKDTVQNKPTTATVAANSNTSDPVALEKAAYTVALDAYKKGGAKQAITPMQNFIKNYPNSIYTGNAYFWLAEFHLAIDPPNYTEAKKNYEIVTAQFPNSSKAARALYQLYSISKDVNKNTQAANSYKSKLLSAYPNSEEAAYFKKS